MAGRGPAPKPAHRKAGHSKDPSMRVVDSEPAPAPEFPATMPGGDPWPQRTVEWWQTWVADPLTDEFRPTDWSELLDTAILHGLLWSGNTKVAAEIRIRVAKHGATAEDRARLRITFAQADEADSKRPKAKPVEQDYGDLRVVGAVAGA